MTLDFTDPRFWLDGVQTLVIAALWLRKTGEDAGEKLKALSARIDVLDERVKHMPTSDELTELKGEVKALEARMELLQETAKGTRDAVIRIETFLRDNK